MSGKRIDWKAVTIAVMPALGFSIGLVLLGSTLGLSEAVAERLSQVVFFPVFFSTYVFITRRRAATLSSGIRHAREALEQGAPPTHVRATPAAFEAREDASGSTDDPRR